MGHLAGVKDVESAGLGAPDGLTLPPMVDAATRLRNADAPSRVRDDQTPTQVRNDQAPWGTFSALDYWRHNYASMQPEDREIIQVVSQFFIDRMAGRRPVRRAIDVGAGTNLYPALLMLPWTERLMLSDHAAGNVKWLDHQIFDDEATWTWDPFWHELQGGKGYDRIGEPRKQLRAACAADSEYSGVARYSVFDLPRAQWQLGTMFFVAESITEDPAEFRAALAGFIGALEPGAPFAATFMAGSDGYSVADTRFPALGINPEDVRERFVELGTVDLSVQPTRTLHRVRPGYAGMIVATGIVGER